MDIYICFPGLFLCCSRGGEGKYNKPKPKQLSHLEGSKYAGCSLISSTCRRHRAIAQHFSPLCSDFLPWFGQQLGCPLSLSFALLPLENIEAFAVFSLRGCWQFRKKKPRVWLEFWQIYANWRVPKPILRFSYHKVWIIHRAKGFFCFMLEFLSDQLVPIKLFCRRTELWNALAQN